MPIYEYECQACQKTFEHLVFKDKNQEISCPCCGSDQTQKRISCASFLGSLRSGTCVSSAPSKGFS